MFSLFFAGYGRESYSIWFYLDYRDENITVVQRVRKAKPVSGEEIKH
jgi:hypothetical protein